MSEPSPGTLRASAFTLYDERRDAEARPALATYLARNPGDAEAHYRLANLLKDADEGGAALYHYRQSLALRPQHARTLNNLGVLLESAGDLPAAMDCYRAAVDAGPPLGEAHRNLGRLLHAEGRVSDAVGIYRLAIASGLDPDLFRHLADSAEGVTTARAPAAYVRGVFDAMATRFDEHLEKDLGYRIPELLAERLRALLPRPVADALDLGCGTGLSGVALRPITRRLVGVDLAPAMLQVAARKAIYDELAEADIVEYMHLAPPSAFDLVMAADVTIYLGRLDDVFAELARVLRPRGLFAFSTETLEGDGTGYELRPSGRYGHRLRYLRELARHHGFAEAHHERTVVRRDQGQPLVGDALILRLG